MKERLQYIKKVNSYVVFTSFILFVAYVLSKNQEVLKAYEQLKDVNNIVNNWDETFLVRAAGQTYAEYAIGTEIFDSKEKRLDLGGETVLLKVADPAFTIIPVHNRLPLLHNVRIRDAGHSEIPTFEAKDIYVRVPWDLDEFIATWNALENPLNVYMPIDVVDLWGFVLTQDTTIFLKDMAWSNKAPTDTAYLSFNPINPDVLYDLFRKTQNPDLLASIPESSQDIYQGHNIPQMIISTKPNPDKVLILFASTQETQFSGQRALLKGYEGKYDVGQFKQTFPELYTITKDFSGILLEDLDPILATFSQRSEDQVELFGAKLPIPAIINWGIPILFVLMLYYYLHLKNLLTVLPASGTLPSEVAWVGSYKGWLSKALTTGSIVVLPIIVTIILLLQAYSTFLARESYKVLIVINLISIGILLTALNVLKTHLKLWAKLR
jgi:hypothetical protein